MTSFLAVLALAATSTGAQIELAPPAADLGAALAAPALVAPLSAAPTTPLAAAPALTAAPALSAPPAAALAAAAPAPAAPAAAASSVLPKSRYAAQIRADASGARTVWIVVPGSPDNPGSAYALGALTTLAAGTPLYHWGGADMDATLASGFLSEAELDARILRTADPDNDLWGGGFYLSSRLADSADYGPRASRTLSSREATVVVCGAIAPSERLDVVLALREAGVDALQETAHPSWYNFVSAGPLQQAFAEPTPQEAIASVRGEPAREAIEDLLLYDQHYSLDPASLPPDAAAPLRALALGLAVDDAGRASLSAAMSKIATMLLLMQARGTPLRRTAIFDAYDGFVRQTTGRSLADILAS